MSNSLGSAVWFVIGIMLGIAANTHSTKNKAYVYLDIDRIISCITTEVANTQASGEELQLKVSQMKKHFETTLTSYQRSHNAIIFSSPKPIKGADDKTDYFIEQIVTNHKHRSNEHKEQNK